VITLSPDDKVTIEQFLEVCNIVKHPKKSPIILVGDRPDTLYYVVRGAVSVLMNGPDGQEAVIAVIDQKHFFGEMGLFGVSKRRSATCVARTDSVIASISYDQMHQFAKDHPRILTIIGRQMSRNLKETATKFCDLAFYDVAYRIKRTLLKLAKSSQAMTHPEGMQISVSRIDLAKMVSCTRETVGQTLKSMENDGLIKVSGFTIVLHSGFLQQ
jgi:CRP/FNR family cyclic AMP-dependent transcriptional regulator